MDLSGLKWPIVILLIVGLGWLGTSGGVNFMYKRFLKDAPGASAEKDIVNEAGLSRLGGYCLKTFQYQKALGILQVTVERFPNGKNVWHNRYRMAKCYEKGDNYKASVDILKLLMDAQAWTLDKRVPEFDNLNLRREKLIEMHELEKR